MPSPVRVGTERIGTGDEEGHVSWGRELTLQGAGKSWVGVLPSSDLDLVGAEEKNGCSGAGEERFTLRQEMGTLVLAGDNQLCSLPSESLAVKRLPRLMSPSSGLF